MPIGSRSAHKILPTAARKRPNVRLCGGGPNRPDGGMKKLARQRAVRAEKRHSIFFLYFLDSQLAISKIPCLYMGRAQQTDF